MSIKLWDWLEDLNWLVGSDFPEADEDALWRCSDAWATAAASLRGLSPEATVVGDRVLASLGGDSGDAFTELWRRYIGQDGLVERAASACDQLAAACDNAAVEVEYAKLQYIAALMVLAAALAALTVALIAGGVSALGMPVAIAAAQFTIRLVLTRLITAIAVGAIMNVALDGLAQAIQLLEGHRHEWDLAKTIRAGEDGAIYGAVGGGVFLAAGRFAPVLLRNPLRLAVPLAATGAIGGVAAPLVHGELPTGRDFLLALTSGVAGGLGPDLVHNRAATPDLSRLDALDRASVDLDATSGLSVDAGPLDLSAAGDGFERSAGGLGSDTAPDASRNDAIPDATRNNPSHDVSGTGAGRDAGPDGDSLGVPRGRSAEPVSGDANGQADAPVRRPPGPTQHDDPGQLAGAPAARADATDPMGAAHPDKLIAAAGPDAATGQGAPGAHTVDRTVPPGRADPLAPMAYGGLGSVGALGSGAAGQPGQSGNPASHPSAPGPTSSGVAGTVSGVSAGPLTGPAVSHTTMQDTVVAIVPPPGVQLGHSPAVPPTSGTLSDVGGVDWTARDASAPPLQEWRGGKGFHLNGLQNLAADRLLQRARDVEPRITNIAREIARDVGGTLRGEEDKFKTADSLKAKLAQQLDRKSLSLSAGLATMKDTLRYTIGLPEHDYARGAQDAVGLLLDRGFRPVSEFRSWRSEAGYLGYNTTWSDPQSGHVFEVQFHTEQSFVAKTISHSLFADIRKIVGDERNTPVYLALQAAHDAYFVDVRVPDGAADVRIPLDVPLHDPSGDLPPLSHSRSADEVAPSLVDSGRRVASDAESVDLARQNVFDTRAGLGFYAADDSVRDFARAVHPTDGYVTLDLHGSARGFQIGDRRLTPDQFADALSELRAAGVLRLPAGVGIKLLSCDTALGGSNSPAAVLARRLGVEVVAPDQPVWTAIDGAEVVSSPTLVNGNLVPTDPPDGTWYRFFPVPAAAAPGPGLERAPSHDTSAEATDGSP